MAKLWGETLEGGKKVALDSLKNKCIKTIILQISIKLMALNLVLFPIKTWQEFICCQVKMNPF